MGDGAAEAVVDPPRFGVDGAAGGCATDLLAGPGPLPADWSGVLNSQLVKTIAPANARPAATSAPARPQVEVHDCRTAPGRPARSLSSSSLPDQARPTASVGVELGTATVLPTSCATVSSPPWTGSDMRAMVAMVC